MASRSSARRYARALFDVAAKSRGVDATLAELQAIAAAAAGNQELRAALTSPGVPLGAKLNVVRAILALLPVSKLVTRFVELVIENDDMNELAEILVQFEQRVLESHNVVRAEITSAVPLTDDQVKAIEASLAAVSGVRVVVTPGVDPALIGGVVAQIGSHVYDGSIAKHLARIRARLVSGEPLQ